MKDVYIDYIEKNYEKFFNIVKKYYCHQTKTMAWIDKKYGKNTLQSIIILNKYFKEENDDLPEYLKKKLKMSKKLFKQLNEYCIENETSHFMNLLEYLGNYFSNEKNC
jgi:hypothetical protein